jgi:cysteine protease ATG4
MNTMNFSSLNNSFQRVFQQIGYLWDPEPKNTDLMNSIWLLGKEYPPVSAPPPQLETAAHDLPPASPIHSHDVMSDNENSESSSTWPRAFLEDFESRVWMTYRSEFQPIQRSSPDTTGMSIMTTVRSHLPVHAQGFTSDQGWGCMVRSGQCVLANALYILHLGRG